MIGFAVVWVLWVMLPVTVFLITAAYYLARNTVNRRFQMGGTTKGNGE